MDKTFKPFSEKSYNKIKQEIGPLRYYIYEEGENISGNIFSRVLTLQNYNCVVAGTGDTVESYAFVSNHQENIVIPKNEQIIVVRLLRFDNTHGDPHYNADDQIIFPIQDGRIFRISRRDAPDHYLKITVTLYELTPPNGKNYTRNNPIKDEDLEDAYKKCQKREVSDNSWIVSAEEIIKRNYDLSAKNPNKAAVISYKAPEKIVEGILDKENKITQIIKEVETVLRKK